MLAILDRRGRTISVVTGGQVVLWVVELGSVITMMAMAVAAAPGAELWPAVPIAVLAAVAITVPDSEAGLLALLGYGGWWLASDRSASWGGVLVGAVAGLVFHLSLAHAAAAPVGAVTDPGVVGSVVVDAGMVVLATGIAVASLASLAGAGVHAPAFFIGVALMLVGLLPWLAALRGNAR